MTSKSATSSRYILNGSAANDGAAFVERIRPDNGISTPVYKQLLGRIVGMIQSGEIADGFSLPSERALAESLDISRTTVRRCYEELRAQNHIDTHGRSGVTVRSSVVANPEVGRLKGFAEEMQELGVAASSTVLDQQIVYDRTIASVFNRPASARFLRITRLRLGDEVPLAREIAWYDLTSVPALADWDLSGSAYEFIEEHAQLTLVNSEQTIESVISNAEESAVFSFNEPGPCLLLKRKTFATTGQVIEYVESTFRGDAYTYRITLKL